MKRKPLLVVIALLLTSLFLLPSAARAGGTGTSADDPMEVPTEGLAITGGTYYGIDSNWFSRINPDKVPMYFSVTIPDTVTTIFKDGFTDNAWTERIRAGAVTNSNRTCNIARIDFSNATNLTTIQSQAANGRTSLTGVLDLSKTKVTTIEKSAFNGCTGLTGVILPDTLEVLGASDGTAGSVFKGCAGLAYVRTSDSDNSAIFDLPASLRVIGKSTFEGIFPDNSDIKIRIPATVEIVGSQAFMSSTSSYSQIFIEREGDFDGYNVGAFKAQGATGCLLIFKDSATYNSVSTFTRATKTYPVTIQFNSGDATVKQLKLYGQSIQYEYDEDARIWSLDEGYVLPEITDLGSTPGYSVGWQLEGSNTILANTSKVSGSAKDAIKAVVSKDAVVANPTVTYNVNGRTFDFSGSGVPEIEVTLSEGNPGSVGIGVTHPLATEEARESGTYVYFEYCWWDEVDNSVNGPRSKTEPELFSSATNSSSLQRVYTEQASIPIRDASDERTDGDYYLVEVFGYYVKNNGKPTRFYKSHHNFIAGDNATDNKAFIMNVTVKDTTPITITPADITVYTGGEGYTGVVDSEGSQTTTANGLPEPGYYITLPDWINDQLGGDSSAEHLAERLVFSYDDAEGVTREWKLALYGTEAHSSDVEGTDRQRYIYRMLPGTDGTGQEIPVRLKLTDSEENVTVSDDFSPNMEEQYQEYAMSIYSGELDPSKITASLTLSNDQTVTCGVKSANGTLVVRGLTGDDVTTAIVDAEEGLSKSGITALGSDQVTYFVNGSKVELQDSSGVRLLVDDVLDDGVLVEYIEENLTDVIPGGDYAYTQRYLDLVDTKNGNAYLTMGEGDTLTIYWRVPDGFDGDRPFYVVHFDALDRNYNKLEDVLSSNPPKLVNAELVTVGDTQYVKFDTGSFSPFVLVWQERGGGSVTPPATTHTITASAGTGGSISPSGEVSVKEGDSQSFAITPDEGNKVRDVVVDGTSVGALGSYTFDDVQEDHTISVTFTRGNAPADPDDTGVSHWFETGDHNAFLHGYADGTGRFGPEDNMTRGEAAQMFYNMLKDKSRGSVGFDFEDLSEDAWYYEAVATLASHGILLGTSPTTVEPERPITRAEFTAMAMRFSKGDLSGENIFTDVFEEDWYYGVVVGSIKYGWISGYDDGTGRFGPNDNITRAQATIIANRMLGRVPDGVYINAHLDKLTRFPDVSEDFYAFRDIVEATNSHDYSKDGGFEHWRGLR